MRVFLPFIVLLIPSIALADEYAPRFRWTPPTAHVSGQPLDPLTDLSEYRLYCDQSIPQQTLSIAPPYEWQSPYGMFPPGQYTCYMTAVGIDNSESAPSGSVTYTVSADAPAPIVIFTVD